MAKYRIQRQFTSWDETIVEADSFDNAYDYARENWQELPVEGVGDYEPTGAWLVVDDVKGEEVSIYG